MTTFFLIIAAAYLGCVALPHAIRHDQERKL